MYTHTDHTQTHKHKGDTHIYILGIPYFVFLSIIKKGKPTSSHE